MIHADWLDIGPVDQLPPLGARTLPVLGGEQIAIFRTANGDVHALVDKCPHKHGPLSQGIVHDTTVTCPLHNWRIRSEEHTYELQSLMRISYAVFCLKKKTYQEQNE